MARFRCEECVKHGTDACFNGGKFCYDECKYKVIDTDYAYEKGKEIGIQQAIDSACDYLWGACIKVDQQDMEKYIKTMCEKKGEEI